MLGVRGLLKAFPTEGALADALRKQKPLLANKKRISRLKRIILKERGDKALIDATEGASRAVSSAERARARRDSIQQQLREAIERVTFGGMGQSPLNAAARTHLQIVEAAASDAEKCVLEAERSLQVTQAKLHKLQNEKEAAEKAREAPKPSKEESSSKAAEVSAGGMSTEVPADLGTSKDLPPDAASGAAPQQIIPPVKALEEADDFSEDDSVDGLDDFEDILANWMHSSKAILTAQEMVASKGLPTWQMVDSVHAEKRRQVAAAEQAATAAESATRQTQSRMKAPQGAGEADGEADLNSESGEEEGIGPDDWDDILAVWMGAVGLPAFIEDGEPDTASESSFEDQPDTGASPDQSTALPAQAPPADATPAAASGNVPQQPQAEEAPRKELPGMLPAPDLAQSLPPRGPQPHQPLGQEAFVRQLAPFDGHAISQFLASYHTGHTNTAGRPMLAVGPQLTMQTSDSLPLLGEDPTRIPQAEGASASAGMLSGPTSDGSMAHQSLQSKWQAMLTQQGGQVPVAELLERGLLGSVSNDNSVEASPADSSLSTPQPSGGFDRFMGRPPSVPVSRPETAQDQLRQQYHRQVGQPGQSSGSSQAPLSIDAARQRALEAILKKHELPADMRPGSSGQQLPRMDATGGIDPSLPTLAEQELLILQQGPQTSQTHDAISFWLERAQQERQQVDAQALQQGLQAMSLHSPSPHALQGMDPFAMRAYSQSLDAPAAMKSVMDARWSGMDADAGALGSHDFTCEVCGITCCGLVNFEQHCSSKKHLRKAAAAAGALTGASVVASDSTDTERNTTYVGLQAQCRSYCKQIISTELNRAVVELLQQLLFWQERAKSASPYNLAKRKRLVEVAKAVRLRKACTVVVAPNIEHIEAEGGLDDLLTSILTQAEASAIPIVFALSRKKLGQMFGCRKKMSAIAILDYSGAEAVYHHMETLAEDGRQAWVTHNGSSSTASGLSLQPQPPAQAPAQVQRPPQAAPSPNAGSLPDEHARPARLTGGSALPPDYAQGRRPPGVPPQQIQAPPPLLPQQQQRSIPQHFGGLGSGADSGYPPQRQGPYDGVPQPPNRPGQQQQFSRYQLPQDPRYPPPSGQYRMQPPTAAQQQQQRRALYEQHMALLHLQQQQQQQGGYEQLSAAQLAELQGVPLAGPMGSDPLMSDEAILGLQAQGQPFDQSQLAALYSQQQLRQQLQLGGLPESEQPSFSLQDSSMLPTWHNPDPGAGPWLP